MSTSESKKVGVTHAIREKLNFLDERLWKRFSARRLELIDAMDLSSKKASEQDAEIRDVANTLRIEFGFGDETFPDFDKLVRAAIQSVRRNRKRSTKSKKSSEPAPKKARLQEDHDKVHFLTEIAKFSDAQEDESYNKTKHFSVVDHSKVAIDDMTRPRVAHATMLPPISNLNIRSQSSFSLAASSPVEVVVDPSINVTLLNYFERSKTCSEVKASHNTDNLEMLGKHAIQCSSAFMLEKSFSNTNQLSTTYLRAKLHDKVYLASFYRSLDPNSSSNFGIGDDIAVVTLNTLVGGCIKDFGFEAIMYLLCEALYQRILQDFPLISRNAEPFRSSRYVKTLSHTDLLNSLATAASELAPKKKAVKLKFLSHQLEFSYLTTNSATPRLVELVENAKLAFKLSYNESQMLGLRNTKNGFVIGSDSDLERIFQDDEEINLELFTQNFRAIPIYELTSAITSSSEKYDDQLPKIILPPPRNTNQGPFNFLSNLDESVSPPPVLLPKFQPLL